MAIPGFDNTKQCIEVCKYLLISSFFWYANVEIHIYLNIDERDDKPGYLKC